MKRLEAAEAIARIVRNGRVLAQFLPQLWEKPSEIHGSLVVIRQRANDVVRYCDELLNEEKEA